MIDATVTRAKAGDVDAINSILGNIQGFIRKHIKTQLGNTSEIDDITQEVIIKVYRNLPNCRATTASQFFGWVTTICRTTCLDRYRRNQRRESENTVRLTEKMEVVCPEPDQFWTDRKEEAIHLAGRCGQQMQKVVYLSMRGYSTKEISEGLGLRRNRVSQLLREFTALAKLTLVSS